MRNGIDQVKRTEIQKRFKRKPILIISLIILLVLSGWVVVSKITGPVKGRAIVASDSLRTSRPAKTKASTALASKINDNQYFTLQLPAGYRPQASSSTVPGLSYQKSIIKPGAFGSIVINIAIKPLPDGGLSGDSSYRSRTESPARFSMSQKNIGGDTVVIFNDSQSASVTAFWPHGGNLATISTTSGIDNPASENTDIIRTIDTILSGWQWR